MIPPDQREEWIIRQARQRPAPERAAFLDGACAGDLALRERLEMLLAAHDQPEEVLADGIDAATVKATTQMDLASEPADESVGKTLGRYKLLEQVGEGGCGVVYVAEQTEPVRRRVALKLIKLGMDTKQVVARFEAERQALAMMDHPNIAKVLDGGTTETGRPFFVMELVRGIRITEYCDQNNLATKDRLGLFIMVCQAIQHAHQKGIIHRDIKPSNILVTLHDGVPVPKVIDFGIAKAMEGRLTDATVYTQLNQFIGTPAYMSPEQAEMSGLDIDTRSDIYSLGVLLYELLAGSTRFDAKELMSQGIEAMRKIIREVEPPRPSTRFAKLEGEELTTTTRRRSTDKSRLMFQLKGDLDWIVMKCLEKDRTRRYETVNGLAADVKRHLGNEPVLARPPSRLYEFQRSVRRHKFGFATAAALVTVLAVGMLVSAREAARANREARRALAEAVAKERLAESQAVSKFMTGGFQSPDPTTGNSHTITAAELTLARKVLGPEHPNTLGAMQNLAGSYSDAGRKDEALKLREEVLTLRRKVLGPEHPDTLYAMQNLANSYVDAGRKDEALKLREEVLTLSRKVLGPEHPNTLLAMNNLANSYSDAGRKDEALKLREDPKPGASDRALAALRQTVAANPADTDRAKNLATVYLWLGQTNEHQAICRRLLDLAANSKDPTAHDRAAKAYLIQAHPDPETLKQAVASGRQALQLAATNDGNRASFLVTDAMVAVRDGKPAEAESLLDEALKVPGDNRDRRSLALAYRALARAHLGRSEKARADLAELEKLLPAFPAPPALSAILLLQPDFLAAGLAHEEAKALLNPPPPPTKP